MQEHNDTQPLIPAQFCAITCDNMRKLDVHETAYVIAQSFVKYEPLCKHLGVSFINMYDTCLSFIEQTYDDQLSLVCRNKKGNIIGGTLCRDLTTPVFFHKNSRAEPSAALLSQLMDMYFPQSIIETVARGEYVEIFTTAISASNSSKGIGRWLIETASSHFANRGYQFSITQSTSPVTQSLRTQCGFKVLGTIQYDDFLFEGEKPFSGIRFDYDKHKNKLFSLNKAGIALLKKSLHFHIT
ncbi:hypothetical protein H0A36_15245 [Endozoicomonas sp. SM1973]|uniref:N-acetyltransferase domain-containing protein n=1 Tax=Spartinivicinus marinus TaxID=2994442 RepID=A0A853I6T0_9GAMM|nr:hypothetical protein [Spartinivicinus marinus]MCX4026215.1 hypothetical protein [Spartinivicinus marinus]NYZ67372.1 hypothetical protein [Spartinivicinus marinus]